MGRNTKRDKKEDKQGIWKRCQTDKNRTALAEGYIHGAGRNKNQNYERRTSVKIYEVINKVNNAHTQSIISVLRFLGGTYGQNLDWREE